MEIIISQPASSECDPSPRRAAVDTGSEGPGTPPQSPTISTRSEPEEPQAETHVEEEISPFKASTDGFLRPNCTSLEQEYILIQSREEYILLQVQPEVGWTTATTPPLHKPPLARSLRDYQLASSKG